MPKAAIIGFGRYIPRLRIKAADIASQWGHDASMADALGIEEKSVPDTGEDSFTLAFEAARGALQMSGVDAKGIQAVYVGSESHPYAVKPTSGMLASALGCSPFCFAADLEFACKAGTAAIQIVQSLVESGKITRGLAVGSDTAQGRPGDALEYTAAAGAAAFVLGNEKDGHALCRIDDTLSYTTDTPDFWRAAGETYPQHAGRFSGEPGYFRHVRTAVKALLERAECEAKDIDHVVLHMPNAKFPEKIAKEFGFTQKQMQAGFIVPTLGNTYAACSPLGLTFVLEQAKKGHRILLVSYGSGSGCDAFLLTMLKDGILLHPDERPIQYLTYSDYLAHTHSLSTVH
jgi:hydroxymethylglutaryl-CoA synthase